MTIATISDLQEAERIVMRCRSAGANTFSLLNEIAAALAARSNAERDTLTRLKAVMERHVSNDERLNDAWFAVKDRLTELGSGTGEQR